jgi:hypothetical protein
VTQATAPRRRSPAAGRTRRLLRGAVGLVIDPVVTALVASPVGGPLASQRAVVEWARRSDGGRARRPVRYAHEAGSVIALAATWDRWWRDLEGGSRTRVRLGDGWHEAWGEAIVPVDPRYAGLIRVWSGIRGPELPRAFGLQVDDHGRVHGDATRSPLVLVVLLLEDAASGL